MKINMIIKIENLADVNTRLDIYLVKKLEQYKRAIIQENILNNNILVNGVATKASYRLKQNDEISIIEIFDKEHYELKEESIPLDIIYEDEDVMVVNKPRHMVVHPAIGHHEHTLVNALLSHTKKLATSSFRPGIVHRLDKDTSGLLLVAKNDSAQSFLTKEIQARNVKRHYMALVIGNISENEGTIIAPLSKDKRHPLKRCVDIDGKDAVTFYRVIKRYGNYTLLDIELKTGRTHQIRVHFEYIGHPLVGDMVYGKNNLTLGDDGQLLHAYKISFLQPTTKKCLTFETPLPSYFLAALAKIN